MKVILITNNFDYYNIESKSFVTSEFASKFKSEDEANYYIRLYKLLNVTLDYQRIWPYGSHYSYDKITREQFLCDHKYKYLKYEVSGSYNKHGKGARHFNYQHLRCVCIKCNYQLYKY